MIKHISLPLCNLSVVNICQKVSNGDKGPNLEPFLPLHIGYFLLFMGQLLSNSVYPAQSMFTIEKLSVIFHVSVGCPLLTIHSNLTECLLNNHLIVIVQDALVHLFLALTNLQVSSHGCICDLQEPFLTDTTLDLCFKRLKAQTLLAEVKPVLIAALSQKCLSLEPQLLGLFPQVLLNKTLIYEGIEGRTNSLLQHLLLDLLCPNCFHLIFSEGFHRLAKH